MFSCNMFYMFSFFLRINISICEYFYEIVCTQNTMGCNNLHSLVSGCSKSVIYNYSQRQRVRFVCRTPSSYIFSQFQIEICIVSENRVYFLCGFGII